MTYPVQPEGHDYPRPAWLLSHREAAPVAAIQGAEEADNSLEIVVEPRGVEGSERLGYDGLARAVLK